MVKCKFCGSETIEVPDFEGADSYGEFHHICNSCGAVGQEVFGHGISWTIKKRESSDYDGIINGRKFKYVD